jgi:hypothetical protein
MAVLQFLAGKGLSGPFSPHAGTVSEQMWRQAEMVYDGRRNGKTKPGSWVSQLSTCLCPTVNSR